MTNNTQWLIDEFPEEHEKMIFFSPDCKKCSFYFSKNLAKISILNEPEIKYYKILKSIRDNNFVKKILSLDLNLKTFKKEKQKNKFKNDLEEAINFYVLYKLSKNNNLKDYKKNSENKGSIFAEPDELKELSKKIDQNTFIYNYSIIECLKLFNNEDIFLYYSPALKEIEKKEHTQVIDILLKQHSKILIHAYDNKIYRKYFKNWKRKKRPDIKNKIKLEYIWKNF